MIVASFETTGENEMGDPTYLKDFNRYIYGSNYSADKEETEKEFYGESDRACGILQSSWIDISLEQSIRYFINPKTDALFKYPAPLSDFSGKISFCYEIGIFGTKTKHDLHLIRTMRNAFAHCMRPISFETPVFATVCQHLQIPHTEAKRIPPLANERNLQSSRGIFLITCYSIIDGLLQQRWNTQPFAVPTNKLP